MKPGIHPVVQRTLDLTDIGIESMRSTRETVDSIEVNLLSPTRDLAVRVSATGEVLDIWIKPGLLDQKSTDDIARQLSKLLDSSATQSVAILSDAYEALTHDLCELAKEIPSLEEYFPWSDKQSQPEHP